MINKNISIAFTVFSIRVQNYEKILNRANK